MKKSLLKSVMFTVMKMSMITILFVLCAGYSFAANKNAQDLLKKKFTVNNNSVFAKEISGIVSNQKGEPMVGASVLIKGTNQGTTTDARGMFTLSVDDGAKLTLEISLVGYQTQLITIGKQNKLKITLVEGANDLNEVVVVGYGKQKKSSLTAAISTIKGNDIAETPVADLSNALVGRAAGIISTQGSGEPGNDGSGILIRGVSSTGNNAPLVIVDGVPRDFTQLDPASIESFSILKDAAAVAPYGMAGANGVILVTTKRGKAGVTRLTYDTYFGFQNPTVISKFASAYQFANLKNAAADNDGSPHPYSAYDLQKYKDHSDPDGHPDFNVLKAIIDPNALMMNHNLSLSGGTDKVKYFMGVGIFSQDGMWAETRYKRYNLISNIDVQATNTTKVSFSINGRAEDRLYAGTSSGTIFYNAFRQPSNQPLRYSNGDYGAYNGNSILGEIHGSGFQHSTAYTALTQFSIEQQLPFIKGLSVKGAVSYDLVPTFGRTWSLPISFYTVDTTQTPYAYNKFNPSNKPALNESYNQYQAFTYQGYLNYQNNFGKSSITGLVVLESRNTKNSNFGAGRINYNVSIPELSVGSSVATDISNSGSSSEEKQASVIYRLAYSYANKYFIEAAGRYDGNYVFAPGHRFGFFPSFSAGWNLSEEKFIRSNFSWIDKLKLRGSYGESGALPYINNQVAAFQYLSSYTLYGPSAIINGQATQGLYENSEPNTSITWERAKKTDIGFESSLFKGLFSMEIDYFREKRNNMLVAPSVTVPVEYGIGLAQENAGRMSNHGIEITVGSVHSFSKDLTAGLNINFTYARNRVDQIFENAATYSNPNRRMTGRPLNTPFGYKALGLFQVADDKNGDGVIDNTEYPVTQFGDLHPGDVKYADLSGPNGKPDGIIDANDQVPIGYTYIPEIIFGFSPNIRFKGFDLTLLFQGATHRSQSFNDEAAWPFFNGGSALASNLDYWTPANPHAKNPRITSAPYTNNIIGDGPGQMSSFWIKDASYLRLKSMSIGYTLSQGLIRPLHIQSARIYASGQNLLTWSKIKDFDPEVSNSRGQYYPGQRVVSVGLNVTF